MTETRQVAAVRADRLLDVIPCGITSFGDDGVVLQVNQPLLDLLGYTRPEVEGAHVESLLGIAGKIFFQTHLYPMVRLHGRASELFVLMRRKDGEDVGTLMNAVREGEGPAAVTHCVFIEVRERRKFEDALVRARQAADEANLKLRERTQSLENANRILEEQAFELQTQQQQLEEQATELEVQSEQLRSVNDELEAHALQVNEARAAADDANQAKSQFLATMSHELRTPLNAIGGYIQLLELEIHGPVTEAQRATFDRILRAQRHLLRLVNDVLNLARIEAGRVEYAKESVSVASLVDSVMPMVEPQMAAGGLTPRVDVEPTLAVLADRDKVVQVLINLLNNAVKFTPRGGTIAVEARADNYRVTISVIDSGIGIPAGKLASVFEPFVQVETSESARREGTGLGLAISRDLARGMGGDLTATSEPGRGSNFSLQLPRA